MISFRQLSIRHALAAALALGVTASLSACGGSHLATGATSGAGSAGDARAQLVPSIVKVINPALMQTAKGHVSICIGGATSADIESSVSAFNAAYKAKGLSASVVLFPASSSTDEQQFAQREQAHSTQCDVLWSDVTYTATFASHGWMYDLTPYVRERASQFLPATLQTTLYAGRYWGVPEASDVSFIYYRRDQIKRAPTTWQQLYADARATHGYVYQGQASESGTCSFLEMFFAAGGRVLNVAGTKSVIDSPQNLAALQFMVNGVKDGAVSKAVTTYAEPESMDAFEAGKGSLLRNWAYAYALLEKDPTTRGKIGVMTLPAFAGGGSAQILGGHNLMISAYSTNPGAALKLIDYITDPAQEAQRAINYTDAPVLYATYHDPALGRAMPFAPQLLSALEHAYARPVSPVYQQISAAINTNVNAALAGSLSPQQALARANSQINAALAEY